MTEEQRVALEYLARLTESGRAGRDPSSECSYGVEGAENRIQLFQMGVTDADLRHFALLPGWQSISLRECPVSDAGLKYLANQTQLRFLDIGETDVTALHPIRECVGLEQLWCDRLERMTDAEAAPLANFRRLWFLDLAYTDTGDATAERLAAVTELRKLNLLGTKISDRGLRWIGSLRKLEILSLHRTVITDEGLGQLQGLRQLRLLAVGETQASKKGRAALKRASPDLKVVDHASIY